MPAAQAAQHETRPMDARQHSLPSTSREVRFCTAQLDVDAARVPHVITEVSLLKDLLEDLDPRVHGQIEGDQPGEEPSTQYLTDAGTHAQIVGTQPDLLGMPRDPNADTRIL